MVSPLYPSNRKRSENLLHGIPSAVEVEGSEAWTKDKEREALHLYLMFFSDFAVTEDISLYWGKGGF